MPPGKRQSPFIGKLVSAEGILYPRYNSVADVLLDPAQSTEAAGDGKTKGNKMKKKRKAAAAAEEAPAEANGNQESEKAPTIEGKKKKKQRNSAGSSLADGPKEGLGAEASPAEADKEPAGTPIKEAADGHPASTSPADANGTDPAAKKREKKKKKKKGKEDVAKRPPAPSGPGNVEQAQQIRNIMGLAPGKAPKKSATANGFSFSFTPHEGAGADEEPETAEPATASARAGPAAAASKPNTSGPADVEEEDPELRAKLRRVMGGGPELVPRRVFVGGMPFYYDEEQVRDYWSYCGEIEDMDLMRFPDTGRFKGIAFITFADETGYSEALKYDGETIDEQQIKVKPCTAAPSKQSDRAERGRGAQDNRRRHSEPAPKTPGYHVAYVGNVAFEASSNELKDMFEGCNVKLVRLHTDKETGKSKGYAHVHFADEASLDRAIQYDGTPFMGREIKVGFAQPKKT